MTVSEFINKVGFKVKDEDVKKVNTKISDIKNTATKLLGAIGIGFSLKAINDLVGEFGAVNKSIKSSIGELQNMDEIQNSILEKANEARVSYSDMAGTVSNLAKSNSELFPIDDAVEFTSTVTKLMKTAGRGSSTINGIMEGLNKSFQKGIVDSETINRMLEQAPETANVLAKSLGVSKDKLLDMASSGSMSVSQLKSAFLDASSEIDSAFQQTGMSISDALLIIRNKWGLWLSQSDKTLELSKTLAKTMVSGFNKVMSVLNKLRTGVVWLSEKLGGTSNLLKMIGIVGGTILAVMKYEKILSFLKTVKTLITAVSAKTLLIIGIIVLLALLVDDFINFMKGNKSVLGTILEKAGVDTDKFRNNIIKIWEKTKVILAAIWQGIKNVAIPIFKGIWQVLKTVFGWIWDLIKALVPDLATMTDELAAGKVDEKKWEKVGEVIAVIAGIILGVIVTLKVLSAVIAIVNAVMAISPITWIILAIVALIAIIIVCIKYWDNIKAAFLKAWDAIKAAWGKVVEFFKGIWDGIVNAFKSVGTWFANLFKSAWEGIKNIWNAVIDFFKGIWDGIVNVFKGVISFYANIYGTAWEAIKAIWSAVISWFKGVWDGIVAVFSVVSSWFSDLFSKAWEGIKTIWSAVINWFKGVWDGIVSVFSVVATWFSGVFTNAWNGIKTAFSTVVSFFKGIWNGITSAFSSVATWFSGIFTNAWNGIKNAFSSVGSFFKGVWDSIVGIFGKIGTSVGNAISGAVKGAINSVISGACGIINGFISAINFAIGLINKIPGVSISKLSKLEVPKLAEGGYVEANKPQTVIIGDNKQEGEIVSPISKMRDTVLDAIRMFVASYSPNSGVANGLLSTASRTIIQNVNINNEFNGDKAIQQSASKAMNNSAVDVTTQLAHGLAYTG